MPLTRLWFFLAAASAAWASDKPRLAVLNFESRGVDSSQALTVSDLARGYLHESGKFQVLERSAMKDILKEQGFQQTGACTEDACAVEMGKILGVNQMAAGSLSMLGKKFILQARLIDVSTGAIVKTAKRECDCPAEALDAETRNLAWELAGVSTASPERKRSRKGPLLWGAAGAVLVGGGAAAYLVMGKDQEKKPPENPPGGDVFGYPPPPPVYP